MIRNRIRWLGLRSQTSRGRADARRRRKHWAIENLEDRLLLSGSPNIYTVTSTSNSTTGTGTSGALPYLIGLANGNTTNTAGSEIVFSPMVFSSPKIIMPLSTLALTAPAAYGPEVIDGPGANLVTINGADAIGIFSVANGTTATIAGLTLTNGNAASGGGIVNQGTLTLSNCTVTGNNATSTSGGGIYNSGTLSLSNCTVTGNSATSSGGGIYNKGTLNLNNCTVGTSTGINTASSGGSIYNSGALTATDCTVTGKSTGALGVGGGIENVDTTTLINSTVSNSSSPVAGGGIYSSGTLILANCTIASNQTGGSGGGNGGGIENEGVLSLTSCTIANNKAAIYGGGISVGGDSTSTTLANTIVAGNSAGSNSDGPDISGTVNSLGYNLIGNNSGSGGFGPTDLQGTASNPLNPLLGQLQNNGGPTPTMALSPGSPAIDAGSNVLIPSAITTDQRGFARIANGLVDIGAFEVQVYTAYSTADSGGGSLRNALNNANQAGGSVVVVTATGVIGLASALPTITQSVQILGPGANNLVVSGSGLYQVFNINSGSSVTIAGLTISDGMVSNNDGGGIENAGALTLTDCTVANNAATGSVVNEPTGGGIYNSGTVTATRCTIANNSAVLDGGGIDNDGTVILANCTIAGNQTSGDGGGIQNEGVLSATNCTIANNSAALDGGGISVGVNSTSTTLANTIVGGNSAASGPDVSGMVTSKGYNLIGNPSGGSGFANNDTLGKNPVIGILQNNGGPTPTIALLPGSPAIGAGSSSISGVTVPSTDQRGVPRPFNGTVDIGAFQSRGFTITVSGGNNQRVLVKTAFPLPLTATVSSPFGDPVQGGVVTFTAPSSGASATFPNGNTAVIDASGFASVSVSANNVVGTNNVAATYTVTPAANGASGTNLSFTLTNLPAPVRFIIDVPNSSGTFTLGTSYKIVVLASTNTAGTQQATGYRGSIQFNSSRVATLPGYYTFVAADNGVHTFPNGIVFGQTGTVYITVYDTINQGIVGQVACNVVSDPPAATTKASSARLARKKLAASRKLQAHAALELQSENTSKARETVAVAGVGSLHRAGVAGRRASVVAQADAAREHILAELRGSLRAYLAAERLT
ncbi:MAG: choice-of-anchor Q domain-containing protein [Isosphaeraceae bacterium]